MAEKFEMFGPLFEILKGAADKANGIAREYKASTGDAQKALDEVLTNSDDKTIAEWRTWNATVQAKIDELVEKQKQAAATTKAHAQTLVPRLSEDEVKGKRDAYLEARKGADLTKKNILALLGNDEAAFKAGVEKYGITEVIGLGGNSQTTGATGIVRKRLASATIDGEAHADSKGKASFTTLSTALKVDGSVIRDAAAKAANVESVKDIPNGTTVSFQVTAGDKTHTVTVTTPDNDEAPVTETPASE